MQRAGVAPSTDVKKTASNRQGDIVRRHSATVARMVALEATLRWYSTLNLSYRKRQRVISLLVTTERDERLVCMELRAA